jgi:hypothetical protein
LPRPTTPNSSIAPCGDGFSFGSSYAELEDFCGDVQRRLVLDAPKTDVRVVVASRLAQLRARFRPRT